LESLGLRVLRFSDEEIKQNLEGVLQFISQWLEEQPPCPPSKGESKNTGNGKSAINFSST